MNEETNETGKIPFTSHLEELRKRLIVCFVSVGIGFALSYAFKEKLFQILSRPLIAVMAADDKLIFTGLPEAFFTYLKVAFLSGIMLSTPIILYEFWMFVAPGLYQKESASYCRSFFSPHSSFWAAHFFGYFIVFPFGFKFFLGFASETIQPLPSMKEYLGFFCEIAPRIWTCF